MNRDVTGEKSRSARLPSMLAGVLLLALIPIQVFLPRVGLALQMTGDSELQAWRVVAGTAESGVSLEAPAGVAIDSKGRIWVTDGTANTLLMLDEAAGFQEEWRGPGVDPGQFQRPLGIAIDHHGAVYVADSGNHRIQKLSVDGEPLTLWGDARAIPDLWRNPTAVATDPLGYVYVAREGGRFGLNHRIDKLTPDGEIVQQWGPAPDFPWGDAPGQFTSPYGVAVDQDGSVYVADTGNHRIQKLSASGEVIAIWGRHGKEPGYFDRPAGITVDPTGMIYVADSNNHRIQVLNPDGTVHRMIESLGPQLGALRAPWGLSVSPSGALYIADSGNRRVVARTSAKR